MGEAPLPIFHWNPGVDIKSLTITYESQEEIYTSFEVENFASLSLSAFGSPSFL